MTEASPRPSLGDVWAWLDEIRDPEIPELSVTDLGIVREVAWVNDRLEVTITPTYAGCPAGSVIALSIETTLRSRGDWPLRIRQQLAPPWTTDWISERGRRRLCESGIAPPPPRDAEPETFRVACPRCGSFRTREASRFGATPCRSHWRCEACLEPFDHFRAH